MLGVLSVRGTETLNLVSLATVDGTAQVTLLDGLAWLAAHPTATRADAERAMLDLLGRLWPNPRGTITASVASVLAADGRTWLAVLQVRDSAQPSSDVDVYVSLRLVSPPKCDLLVSQPAAPVAAAWSAA